MRNLLDMEVPWEKPTVVWKDNSEAYALTDVTTQWDYGMEGYLLAHCIGTKDADEFNKAHRVLSLRDKLGISHCTVLLQRDHTWSPYGNSADMLTRKPLTLDGDKFFVLQVRGREDNLARWEYYKLIRQWYIENGGKINGPYAKHRAAVLCFQDRDMKYHYGYMLDESKNHFDWAHHNEEYRKRYRELGLSL